MRNTDSSGYKFIAVRNQTAIQDVGIKIRTIRPRDGTEFRVNFHLGEGEAGEPR